MGASRAQRGGPVADRGVGQGPRVNVGRYVRPELRPVLAQEIRRALRGGEGGEARAAAVVTGGVNRN